MKTIEIQLGHSELPNFVFPLMECVASPRGMKSSQTAFLFSARCQRCDHSFNTNAMVYQALLANMPVPLSGAQRQASCPQCTSDGITARIHYVSDVELRKLLGDRFFSKLSAVTQGQVSIRDTPDTPDTPESSNPIALRDVLRENLVGQFEKSRRSSSVPEGLPSQCEELFTAISDDVAARVSDNWVREVYEHHKYEDLDSGIYMVVSVMPWETEQAIRELARLSKQPPTGYMELWTNLFVNNWPSENLEYWYHIVLCSGASEFRIHTGVGASPMAARQFQVVPIELLNRDELRLTGLG